jgi:hypothetical protein
MSPERLSALGMGDERQLKGITQTKNSAFCIKNDTDNVKKKKT